MFNKTHEALFEFCDPLQMKIGGNDDSRRDLNVFLASEELAGLSVDADEGNGELNITVPDSCRDLVKSKFLSDHTTVLSYIYLNNTHPF